jgi:hypothetical protein
MLPISLGPADSRKGQGWLRQLLLMYDVFRRSALDSKHSQRLPTMPRTDSISLAES